MNANVDRFTHHVALIVNIPTQVPFQADRVYALIPCQYNMQYLPSQHERVHPDLT